MFNVNVQFDIKGVKKGEVTDEKTNKVIEFYQAVTMEREVISINKKIYDAFRSNNFQHLNLGIQVKPNGGLKFIDLDDWGDLEELDF